MKTLLRLGTIGSLLLTLNGCVPYLLLPILLGGQAENNKKKTSEESGPIRRPLETTESASVKFFRKKQMITKYDCNGHVTSHALGTVEKKLSKTFTVNYPGRKKAWSTRMLNRRNGSEPVFPSRSEGQFTVDLSPTLNHIRVSEGENPIEYVFYKCPEVVTENGTKKCIAPLVVEKEGIFHLTVEYEEIFLPGNHEVRPSPQTCGN